MGPFILTRKEMADLLVSLQGKSEKTPLAIMQEVWTTRYKPESVDGVKARATSASTALPAIIEKIMKVTPGMTASFSINEIVALGNQLEYNSFSSTTVQNWVKRDVKELIGKPQDGKKYTVDQAASIYIVEDLKTILDFESIRKLLKVIFQDPDDIKDDLISPVRLYAAYSTIFEDLDVNNDQVMDIDSHKKLDTKGLIENRADIFTSTLGYLNDHQRELISDTIVIATLSIQTAYFQALAKRTLNDIILTGY
jgi:hypothetical protein